jgi:hypothetical protein
MPVFFVLAGIFGALVVSIRGLEGAGRDRLLRIGLPLPLGAVLLVPLVEGAFSYAVARALGGARATPMLHPAWPSAASPTCGSCGICCC